MRPLLFAALLFVSSSAVSGQDQPLSVLHITAAIADAEGKAMPVPRHALLISAEPPTAAPRRIFTELDGTANVRLRPGTYTVESDRPAVFSGKTYQWTQHVTVAAGRDADLALTAGNAEIETASAADIAADIAAAPPAEIDTALLRRQWQDSIVAIWTPTARGSGFLIDSRGVIATSQRLFGLATSAEVQLSPTVKVAARLLAADQKSDVALLWIDPMAIAAVRPIPLACADGAKPPAVFDLPVDAVCDLVATAEPEVKAAMPPAGTRLPVEPLRPFPEVALKELTQGKAGTLNPYLVTADDFEVAFITPVQIYAAQAFANQQRERLIPMARPLFEFGNWSEYVADHPPVLLIRVTPKMVERFWTTVGRVAARTQGMDLPAFKHVKAGFARMQLFCGETEVTPIHRFTIERQVSDQETIDEGLYAFDPGALGPQCGSVRLVLYSEKEPLKGDTRVVDPRVVQQVWQDFSRYRE